MMVVKNKLIQKKTCWLNAAKECDKVGALLTTPSEYDMTYMIKFAQLFRFPQNWWIGANGIRIWKDGHYAP